MLIVDAENHDMRLIFSTLDYADHSSTRARFILDYQFDAHRLTRNLARDWLPFVHTSALCVILAVPVHNSKCQLMISHWILTRDLLRASDTILEQIGFQYMFDIRSANINARGAPRGGTALRLLRQG